MKKIMPILFSVLIALPTLQGIVKAVDEVVPSQVLITSLRVNSTKEIVEITNNSDIEVDVDGWKGTYTNATGGNLKTIFTLSGVVSPHASIVYASPDYITQYSETSGFEAMQYSGMADSGGFVRLYKKTDITIDYPDGFLLIQTVGWSSQASTNPQVATLTGTNSLKRCTDLLGNYRPEKDVTDFIQVSSDMLFMDGPLCNDIPIPIIEEPGEVIPPVIDETTTPDVDVPPPEADETNTPTVEQTGDAIHCQGVVISEILPNPDGDDTDREFVELYNSNDNTVELDGCSLELNTTSNNTLDLSNIPIEPKQYLALRAFGSNFILPNASGGSLTLMEGTIEINTTDYPGDMEDDQSWALSDYGYVLTFSPTPGSENIITSLKSCEEGYTRNAETGRCNKIQETTLPLVCATGYFLNSSTNRCNKIVVDTPTADCPVGQERNPQTNRCRSIVITASLMPCAVGQERNPLTNRCRSIEAATSQLIECKEGQERNPETNRCRTVVLGTTSDGGSTPVVMDVEAPQSQSVSILGILCIVALATAYAVYEWRLELIKVMQSAYATVFALFHRIKFMNKS